MEKKLKQKTPPSSTKEHIIQLVEWMSQGVYEKEQIIAMALLCAVAGENMFLLGPPGTAKSMVASRLKMIFKDGKSFDYLMSRFSTPDEIFGPVSISRLKNEDRYERLTTGYLPDADVIFLDEIWKAGPSIQNTLLTVINEHVFHNGGQTIRTPMKVLIAASNELPAKDEGLEALWDRFLVRMVSNCIESDTAFFKMIKGKEADLTPIPEDLYITEELYNTWQRESREVGMGNSVAAAIKAIRKSMSCLEKEDGNQLRYYISDRRWRKAYRLMQTSAYLNGRTEINMSDFLLLIHSLWNDAECIPNVLNAFTASISDTVVRTMNKIDKHIHQLIEQQYNITEPHTLSRPHAEQNKFAEFDHLYFLVDNFPSGDTYFSKWEYASMDNQPKDGVRYYDAKQMRTIIHIPIPDRPFDIESLNAKNLTKITIQKCQNGIIIDGIPYTFRRYEKKASTTSDTRQSLSTHQKVAAIQDLFKTCISDWEKMIATNFTDSDNIFLSNNDITLVNKTIKEINRQINTLEVKLNNVILMMQ